MTVCSGVFVRLMVWENFLNGSRDLLRCSGSLFGGNELEERRTLSLVCGVSAMAIDTFGFFFWELGAAFC